MRLGGDRNTPRRGLSFLYTSESFSQKYLRDATNGKHRSHKPFLAFVTVGDAYSVTGGGGPDPPRLPPGRRAGPSFFPVFCVRPYQRQTRNAGLGFTFPSGEKFTASSHVAFRIIAGVPARRRESSCAVRTRGSRRLSSR